MSLEMIIVLLGLTVTPLVSGLLWWEYVSESFTGRQRLVRRLLTLPVVLLAFSALLTFIVTASAWEEKREWQRCQMRGRC